MTARRIEATDSGEHARGSRDVLYVSGGSGNLAGVREARLTFYDGAADREIALGWFPVEALRDALDAIP